MKDWGQGINEEMEKGSGLCRRYGVICFSHRLAGGWAFGRQLARPVRP